MSFFSFCLLWDLWGRHGRNKTSQKLPQIKAVYFRFRFLSIVYLKVKKKVEFPEPLFLILSSPDFNKLIGFLR